MHNDFYVALISGWFILLAFWSIILIFVYLRKPPNSKLTKKIIIKSYVGFILFLLFIIIFGYTDSF